MSPPIPAALYKSHQCLVIKRVSQSVDRQTDSSCSVYGAEGPSPKMSMPPYGSVAWIHMAPALPHTHTHTHTHNTPLLLAANVCCCYTLNSFASPSMRQWRCCRRFEGCIYFDLEGGRERVSHSVSVCAAAAAAAEIHLPAGDSSAVWLLWTGRFQPTGVDIC